VEFLELTAASQSEKVNMNITCPNCQSRLIHRSQKKGMIEAVFLAAIFFRPFRCEKCDSRFFQWSFREKPGPARPIKTS